MTERAISRLQQWANANEPPDEMLWKQSYWHQISFVRDMLPRVLARNWGEVRDLWEVAGSHRSKSINLPVYKLDLSRLGVVVWMRNNFYNWNVSVESDRPVTCDFLDTFDPEDGGYNFCEGMEEKKFGTYSESSFKFTVTIPDNFELYCFFKCLRKFLGIRWEG